jgi:hypothetical protein
MGKFICQRSGKVAFVRHQDAAKVVGDVGNRHRIPSADAPKSIYQCEHCGRWHVTGYPPELNRQIQRAVRRKQKGAKP